MTKQSKKSKQETQEETGFSFDSIDSVHDEILESSPDVNQAYIEGTEAAQAAASVAASDVKDSEGAVFNSELHAVNKDGEPSLTATGKFRKKRGASKVAITNTALAEQQKLEKDRIAARAAGQLAADMLIGSSVTLLGDEWVPIGSKGTQEPIQFDEHSNLRRAFADYFEAKNISDFPPGIMLSIAVTSYAMPRLVAGKETKTRLAKMKIWIAERYNKMKRSRKDAAQSHSRDNGKRKDNASKADVSQESTEATRHPRT